LTYYPPPESESGWRVLKDQRSVRSIGEVDAEKLSEAWKYSLRSKAQPSEFYPPQYIVPQAASSGLLVVRHGYVVGEWYQNAERTTRWNIHSCTKSFTGTAYGLLFQDSVDGSLPGGREIALNSGAYSFIPEGYPLTDPRKEKIKICHLLSMTSNIRGEESDVFGLHPAEGYGAFELALGRCPTVDGVSVAELTGEPGTRFEYSDAAFAHLSLIFFNVTGMELEDYMRQRVFDPIGIENVHWDSIGGGDGNIGPHTVPNGGLHTTARDLARFGYLTLKKGVWEGRQIVPARWMEKATKPSQSLNRNYGYTWWLNTQRTPWEAVPEDMFAAMGFAANKCYVIPSLDLVVARIGYGPWPWDDVTFLRKVASSIL